MKKSILSVVLLIIVTAFVSCDIQKRIYRPGYLVAGKTHKKTLPASSENRTIAKNHHEDQSTGQPGLVENPVKDEMLVSINESGRSGSHFSSLIKEKKANDLLMIEGCDTIVFKNGMLVKAKVLEISATETKYKYCDNPEGPLFTKLNSEIKLIKHSNGSVTELSNSETAAQTFTREASNLEKKMSGKSQLTALLLCIFVGVIGVHRFYLGYTGIGILMLCTLGCCGIFTLIDLIRIITGDLKPKDGEYSEKL
jgi:TM2 domain-containing membrane protein YozV